MKLSLDILSGNQGPHFFNMSTESPKDVYINS